MQRTISAGMAVAVSLLWTVAVQAGGTPAAKCEAGKNKEAGKYAACRAKAESKLVATAGACSLTAFTVCYRDDECPLGERCEKDRTTYSAAMATCESKFSTKWSSLEWKAAGACPTTADQSAIEGQVRDHAQLLAWELSGTARFVDNADGTITDQKTGLMWEKKVKLDSNSDYGYLQDADNFYRWANLCSANTSKACQPSPEAAAACADGVEAATTDCVTCTGTDGTCTYLPEPTIWQWLVDLRNANFAAHNDWRLPTREELLSIVDYADTTPPVVYDAFHGVSCGGACVDLADPACSCTHYRFWSASPQIVASAGDYAWVVNFSSGELYTQGRLGTDHVRAVRGGP